jgi:hypothetical protein
MNENENGRGEGSWGNYSRFAKEVSWLATGTDVD